MKTRMKTRIEHFSKSNIKGFEMFSPLRYKPPTKIEIPRAFTLHKEEIPQASGLPLSIIKCEP